ncbi:MAG: MBL fold metallo-hydrolase, partial [Clostridia bacterium]
MSRSTRRLCLLLVLIIASAALCAGCTSETPLPLHIDFLDVGAGDAALLTCGTHAMMIDTGDKSHQAVIQEALESHGVTRLDILVLSHPHSDHIGNAAWLLENYPIDKVYMTEMTNPASAEYNRMMTTLYAHSTEIHYPAINEQFSFCNVK